MGTIYLDISSEFMGKAADLHTQATQLMELPLGTVMGGMLWADMGFCAMAAGDLSTATELFDKGFEISTAMKLLARPQLLVGKALVELGQGNPGNAAESLREAREFAEERSMKHFYPLIAFGEGQAGLASGDGKRALEHFARGEELALGMKMRLLLWQLQAGATQALSMDGRSAEADAKRRQARDSIDEIAGLFEDQELSSSFVKSETSRLP